MSFFESYSYHTIYTLYVNNFHSSKDNTYRGNYSQSSRLPVSSHPGGKPPYLAAAKTQPKVRLHIRIIYIDTTYHTIMSPRCLNTYKIKYSISWFMHAPTKTKITGKMWSGLCD